MTNDLTEEETTEPTPSEDPDKENNGNTNNQNNNSGKVETGNYADSAVFVGMLGAVIATIGIVLYLKKRNRDSEA